MRVVVLGGGLAGLATAERILLQGAAGLSVTVLEAATRPGGPVSTIREDGFVLERGPNTLRTNRESDVLLTRLGLDGEVVRPDERAPRWIYRGGAPQSVIPGPQGLFTKALRFGEKLRVLGDLSIPKRRADLEDESVHGFFERRFGAGLARYAAGPMVSGVYADDPRTLSVRSAFPALWDAEARGGGVIRGFLKAPKPEGPRAPRVKRRTVNFRTGLERLVEALAARIAESGGTLHLNAPALALEGPEAGSAPWVVRTAAGSFEADRLVSTLPAPALAALLGDRLPRSGAGLAALRTSSLAVVIQAFRVASPGDAPQGFGVLVPREEGIEALGVLYPSALFSGRAPEGLAITTSFLGGALSPELASAPEADLLALAEREARHMHPRLGPRERAWIARWPSAIPRLPLGHHATLAALELDLAALPHVFVTGNWRDGVAMGDRIARADELGRRVAGTF